MKHEVKAFWLDSQKKRRGVQHYLTLLIAISLAIISCSESKETRMLRLLMQGNAKISTQEYEQAEKYFTGALKLDSCFADALNNLGSVYHHRQDFLKAVHYYSKAIGCRQDFSQAYINRANVYYETGEFQLALNDLKAASNLAPDTIAIPFLKGLVLWKAHQYEEAKTSFLEVVKRDRKQTDALVNLGTIEAILREYDSGRFHLQKALSLEPGFPNGLNALGFLEAEAGNAQQAAEWLAKALEAEPNNPYFINNYGYALLLVGKAEEGIKLIDNSIAADPANGWAYRNKGMYYVQQKRFDDAIRILKKAESLDSTIINLYGWLAEAYEGKGERSQMCHYYVKAKERGDRVKDVDKFKGCK
jgi:tetratricopeptide (TPR) repeat protein